MTPETKQLVIQIRAQIPTSISLCQQALAVSNNNPMEALSVVRQFLIDIFVSELAMSHETAQAYLVANGYDTELASRRWRFDNPSPPLPNGDALMAGVELAHEIPSKTSSLSKFVHIIPENGGTYDFRLISHHPKYTEEHYGLDYDYAIFDSTTRVSRFNQIDFDEVLARLQSLNIKLDDLVPPDSIDSCLLNTTIDTYLVPDRHPHLWQGSLRDNQ